MRHDIKTMSNAELDALADRIFNRAISMLFDAQPELKTDMLTAAGALRALIRERPQDELQVRVFKPNT